MDTTNSPDTLSLQPEVRVTRLNRRAFFLMVILLCFIVVSFVTMLRQNDSNAPLAVKLAMNQKLEPSPAPQNLLVRPVANAEGLLPSSARQVTTTEEENAKKLHEQILEEDLKARTSGIAVSSFTVESRKLEPLPVAVTTAATGGASADSAPPKADDDPNKQARKERFLKDKNQEANYLQAERTAALSPYEVKAGSQIPAVMISGINSDLPGMITAQVRESVYDTRTGKYLLIPQGAKLVGRYDSQIAYGQSRVLVVWERIIFPDTSSISLLSMPGADTGGYAGFTDQVNNHFARIFGSAILMSIIEAGAELSQPQSNTTNAAPTPGQVAAASVGVQLAQTSNGLLQKNLSIQPTLEVRPGYKFNVMVSKDMILPGAYTPIEPTN